MVGYQHDEEHASGWASGVVRGEGVCVPSSGAASRRTRCGVLADEEGLSRRYHVVKLKEAREQTRKHAGRESEATPGRRDASWIRECQEQG